MEVSDGGGLAAWHKPDLLTPPLLVFAVADPTAAFGQIGCARGYVGVGGPRRSNCSLSRAREKTTPQPQPSRLQRRMVGEDMKVCTEVLPRCALLFADGASVPQPRCCWEDCAQS